MADVTYSTLSTATTVGTGNATDGTGNFDNLMKVVTLHLEDQFTAGRITGTDYANVYLGALQSTLDQAVSFTLSMNKSNADVNLVGKQEDLVDKQILTEAAKELQVDAQTALIDQQEITEFAQTEQATAGGVPAVGSLLALQALKVEQDTALVADQEALVAQQKLTEEKNTTLVNKQATTETAKATDLGSATSVRNAQSGVDTTLKGKQGGLVDSQSATEVKKALDLVSSTSVRNAQSTADSSLKGKQGLLVDAQKGKTVDEGLLLIQKKYTEFAQTGNTSNAVAASTSVIGKQNLLFVEQAKGFKWNADAKYFKTVMDAYAINVSVSKEDDSTTAILQGSANVNSGIAKVIADMEPS